MKTIVCAGLTALLISLGTGNAFASDQTHSHGGDHGKLTLDHGRKWPTDEALRQGMSEIRAVTAAGLSQAHSGGLDTAGYARLADLVSAQVESITRTCALPAATDAQLHLVLADIIDGTGHMQKGKTPAKGLAKVISGLDAYGKYFDHPGWQQRKH